MKWFVIGVSEDSEKGMEAYCRRFFVGAWRVVDYDPVAAVAGYQAAAAGPTYVPYSYEPLGVSKPPPKGCPFCGRTDAHSHTAGPFGMS